MGTRGSPQVVDASVDAYRFGLGVAGGLVVVGGVISLVGIVNPRREVRCADCPGGALLPTEEHEVVGSAA